MKIILSTHAEASALSNLPGETYWSAGVGQFCEQIKKVKSQANDKADFCNARLMFNADFLLQGIDEFYYGLNSYLTLPHSPRDEKTKRMLILIAPTAKYLWKNFSFSSSLGIQFLRIWGDGGEVELNNGTGTQSFNVPSEARYARNTYFSLGFGYEFYSKISLNTEAFSLEPFASDKRSFSLFTSLQYRFGEWW